MSARLLFTRESPRRYLTQRLERLEDRLAPAVATWDGGGADNHWTTAANWVGDVAPMPSDDLVFPETAQQLNNVNDFPDGTAFGSLHTAAVSTGNGIALAGGIRFEGFTAPVPTVGLPITLTADQTFANNGPAGSKLTGPVNLNGHALSFTANHEVDKVVGDISGAGSVTFSGPSHTIFPGQAYEVKGHNTYTGPTVICNGRVDVSGSIAGPVTVTESMPGTSGLSGLGSVGDLTVTGGELQIMNSFAGPNLRTGNLTLLDGARSSDFVVGVGANPLSVTGTVHLAGTVQIGRDFGIPTAIALGQQLPLIDNDRTDPVIGRFANAPEGAVVRQVGDIGLRITYKGGDGNDVVLTAVALPTYSVAVGPGGFPIVKVYDAAGTLVRSFNAYEPTFHGGVHVVTADVTGDNVPDTITAPGPGGGPLMRIWDGQTGAMVKQFLAYDGAFRGGVNLSVAHITIPEGEGLPNIITGAGPGGGPHVKVFDATTLATVSSFFAFDPAFRGGVTVAGTTAVRSTGIFGYGDVIPGQVITGVGPGGQPLVRLFAGTTGAATGTVFMAYDPNFRGGVNVAWDGQDIVTAPASGGQPLVRLFLERISFQLRQEFMAYDAGFLGGVNILARPFSPSGVRPPDIVTGAGPGGGPHVRIWTLTASLSREFFAFDPTFTGGVFVG